MTHPALPIADEVATVIRDAAFAGDLTVRRTYVARLDLASLRGTHVDVVPSSMTETRLDRATLRRIVSIDIAIRSRLLGDDDTAGDAILTTVDQIAALFRLRPLPSGAARNTEITHVLFSADDIERHRVITSVLRLDFATRNLV